MTVGDSVPTFIATYMVSWMGIPDRDKGIQCLIGAPDRGLDTVKDSVRPGHVNGIFKSVIVACGC